LFDRFFGAPTEAPGAAGPGLGLPIAAAIARAHGGTIEVQSVLGSGSSFIFRVPVHSPEVPEVEGDA
jgi:two-component system sensor histidine kinase BaeS